MNQNYLPPLLRGTGMTIVLLATIISVLVARKHVQTEENQRAAIHEQAETDAAAQPAEKRNLAELKVEVDDLRSEIHEDSVAEEVIENPWFNWIGLAGTAIIASSFYTEAFLQRRQRLMQR
jgi:hypothetical protein